MCPVVKDNCYSCVHSMHHTPEISRWMTSLSRRTGVRGFLSSIDVRGYDSKLAYTCVNLVPGLWCVKVTVNE